MLQYSHLSGGLFLKKQKQKQKQTNKNNNKKPAGCSGEYLKSPGRQRQEEQKFKLTLDYTVCPRLAWHTGDPISKGGVFLLFTEAQRAQYLLELGVGGIPHELQNE